MTMLGKVPWNKGLTREDPRVNKYVLATSAKNRGKKFTDERRKKLSEAKKGKPNGSKGRIHSPETKLKMSLAHIGKNTWMFGNKPTAETRLKISLSHKGDKSYLWKGGITVENKVIRNNVEYKIWRDSVFESDNWTCCKCNKRDGGYLHSHHIESFHNNVDKRFKTDNGITMCKNCHIEFHKSFGFRDNNAKQLEKYLTNKL